MGAQESVLANISVCERAQEIDFEAWMVAEQERIFGLCMRLLRNRDKIIQLRSAVDKAENILQQIMNEDKVDFRRGQEAIDQVVTTRAEMVRVVAQMSLKLRVTRVEY